MLAVQGSKFDLGRSDGKNGQRSNLDFSNAFDNHGVLSQLYSNTKRDNSSKNSHAVAKKDEVTIHVCDEGRNTSKYFFCQRNLLTHHMKYFERFLAENESSCDLDISVHCDVEIFEWLMNYIHDPCSHPQLDKSILVSILISSEFLQMDALVDICLENMAARLHEIIKLPIDLSCISDKLVNKLAALTHPEILSKTQDRKDKILNKLYKRRVELDFSRRGGVRSSSGVSTSNRSIAASLTCCKHCGIVYLENYVSSLSCLKSAPLIGFRGDLVTRHSSISGWSLTSYLKMLHAGGMSWEAIYWHVWGACVVMRPAVYNRNEVDSSKDSVENFMISGLDGNRYLLEPDGLLLYSRPHRRHLSGTAVTSETSSAQQTDPNDTTESKVHANPAPSFSLSHEVSSIVPEAFKIKISHESFPMTPGAGVGGQTVHTFTPSLNPYRPPEVMSPEIFELLHSQAQLISGGAHRDLLSSTARAVTLLKANKTPLSPLSVEPGENSTDYAEILWKDSEARARVLAQATGGDRVGEGDLGSSSSATGDTEGSKEQGRARSNSRARKIPGRSASRVRGVGAVSFSSTGGLLPSQLQSLRGSELDSERGDNQSSKGVGTPGRAGGPGLARRASCPPSSFASLNILADDDRKEGSRTVSSADPIASNLCVLTALPPDIIRLVEGGGGALGGLWVSAHPLQVQPLSLVESLQAVSEYNYQGQTLSAEKQQTWQIDLLREYDEQRMERYETFLSSKRSPCVEDQLRSRFAAAGRAVSMAGSGVLQRQSFSRRQKSAAATEYYRDKGRQAHK